MTSEDNFQIFLCHANDDKPIARAIYDYLRENLLDVWFDEENLLAGGEWRVEIPKAIKKSDVVLLLLSNHAITKEGYFQNEIKLALEVANEKPDGTIFIIPLRLEDCKVPQSLEKWQYIDYFEKNWFEKLIKSLRERAERIGKNLHLLKTEFDLSFICEICNNSIDIYKDEGAIYVLWDKIHLAEEISNKESISIDDLLFSNAHWHTSHYACRKDVGPSYEIEIYRIRTLQKLLLWTAHLMEKNWLEYTDWRALIRDVIGEENSLVE